MLEPLRRVTEEATARAARTFGPTACASAVSADAASSSSVAVGMPVHESKELWQRVSGRACQLALAVPLHMWSYKKQTPFNRPWLPAECKILNFEEQSHRLYMHGDYLRNSHPNDGIYYVLQPAWRTAITPSRSVPETGRAFF